MAFKDAKKSNRMGPIPTRKEVGNNLKQPEHAPNNAKKTPKIKSIERTEQLAFKVSKSFLKDFKMTALTNDMKQIDLLEATLAAFKKKR